MPQCRPSGFPDDICAQKRPGKTLRNFGYDTPFLPNLRQAEDRGRCCFFLTANCRIFSAPTVMAP